MREGADGKKTDAEAGCGKIDETGETEGEWPMFAVPDEERLGEWGSDLVGGAPGFLLRALFSALRTVGRAPSSCLRPQLHALIRTYLTGQGVLYALYQSTLLAKELRFLPESLLSSPVCVWSEIPDKPDDKSATSKTSPFFSSFCARQSWIRICLLYFDTVAMLVDLPVSFLATCTAEKTRLFITQPYPNKRSHHGQKRGRSV